MRLAALLMATGVTLAAVPAFADPTVRLDHLIARVIVIPEARANIIADVKPGRSADVARPTLQVSGSDMVITGNADAKKCQGASASRVKLGMWKSVSAEDLPVVTIHTPPNVTIEADGAVIGQIGASQSLNLHQKRCGNWTIGDVSGRLNLALSGMGDVKAGSAGSALLHVSGMGDVHVRSTGALTADLSGMGDLVVDQVSGPVEAVLSGMGDIHIRGGHATTLHLRQSGMGDVSFDGVADTLDASASGMGGITVARVTGPVRKSQSGFSKVTVKSN
jgi:hypothetical protein